MAHGRKPRGGDAAESAGAGQPKWGRTDAHQTNAHQPMRTILVVDDDESFREMLRTCMEMRGVAVLMAAHPGEALELAACHHVDAVVSDYQMPGMDGLAFCRQWRAQNARLDRVVPFWLITG